MSMIGRLQARLVEHGHGYRVEERDDGTILYSAPDSNRSVVLSNEGGRIAVQCSNGERQLLTNDDKLIENIVQILEE